MEMQKLALFYKENRIFAPFKIAKGMKYDVFISYSRKETAIADQICAAFDKAGISYFIDRQGIGGGMEFPKVIAPAIKESEVFLLLASQNAYESPFTDREITFAFNKKRGEKMLPYIIDDAPFPEHLELIFSTNNWLILKLHPIESKLVDDVLRLLGRTRSVTENESQPKQKRVVNSATQMTYESELEPKQKDGKWGFIDMQGNVVIPFEYEYAHKFFEELACVMKNGKLGFINKHGNIIIPFEYENSWDFSEGLAAVKKDGKWGVINKQGNAIVPFVYDITMSFSEGLAAVKKNGNWGIIDKHGHVVIPCEYERTISFSEGLACVEKNGRWGFIDKKGDTVIPFIFTSAEPFNYGKAKVTKKNLFGKEQTFYIDKQGNRIN